MDGTVLYERDGAVATLALGRPERFNAIVPALIDDLEAALDRRPAVEWGLASQSAPAGELEAAVPVRDAPFGDDGQEPR